MKSIKKLKIIFRIAMLSLLVFFFLPSFKNNIGWGIAFVVLLVIFILYRFIFYKKKNIKYKDYYSNYNIHNNNIHNTLLTCILLGAMLLFFAIISSLITILDLKDGNSIPLWAIFVLLGTWIFGILLMYYSYQAWKESSLKSELKPKREIDKIKKFNINSLIAFMIIAAIISFIFKLFPLKLENIFISIFAIIFMYFFLRIILQK